jgi:hypothetical protein
MYEIEEIIQEIAKLYYTTGRTKHDTIPWLISRILWRFGFQYKLEYELDKGYRELYGRRGFLDVMAWNDYSIGIEFDSRIRIRMNSIRKLEYIKPDVAIFVIGKGCLADQYDRIENINNIQSKRVYLVFLTNHEVIQASYLERLPPPDPTSPAK